MSKGNKINSHDLIKKKIHLGRRRKLVSVCLWVFSWKAFLEQIWLACIFFIVWLCIQASGLLRELTAFNPCFSKNPKKKKKISIRKIQTEVRVEPLLSFTRKLWFSRVPSGVAAEALNERAALVLDVWHLLNMLIPGNWAKCDDNFIY